MSTSLFITNRFVRSRKDSRFISPISIISIVGIALGVAVLIIALTVLRGFEDAITDKIIRFNSHIKITAFRGKNLPGYSETIPKIEEITKPYSESISPFISKYAIIKSKRNSEGIELTGVNPKLDNSEINQFITSGNYNLDIKDELQSIVIGKKLADKLFLNIGDRVTIFTLRNDAQPSYDNPPSIRQFKVQGFYESGMAEYDDVQAFINMDIAHQIFDIGNQITGYNIRVNDISKIDTLSNQLQSFLGYPYYVRTIFKVHQNIFTWLDLQKEPIPIVLGLIIFVAVFNIVGTLLMTVLERTNAIGILKSLGASKKQIIKVFLYQGVYIALIGIFAGNVTAFILSKIQKDFNVISLPDTVYFISAVPISIDWFNYLLVSVIAFLLCISASLIPSYIASKVNPVSAIRFD